VAFDDRWARDERAQDELRRYGLEYDPRADHEYELGLADRLAD
jgi:hypothetical protein